MMINELRYRNWVKIDGVYCQITMLEIYQVSINKLEIHPIILTDKWLKDFGFKNNFRSWELNKFELYDHSLLNDLKDLRLNDINFCTKIRYVHQLQNLCFALTNIELTCDQ